MWLRRLFPWVTCFSITFLIRAINCFMPEVLDRNLTCVQLGDLNIGGIMSLHDTSRGEMCIKGHHERRLLEYSEALKYGINVINSRNDILPNIDLGYVILDDCSNPRLALARALQFMPKSYRGTIPCDDASCDVTDGDSAPEYFDVIGVVGALTSQLSIVIANAMTLFKIPQISHTATNDLLSNKDAYPYFLRMISPDRFQVRVMGDLLNYYNWTYVSTIHSNGVYGRNGNERLSAILKENDICIATSIEVNRDMDDSDFDAVFDELRRYKAARVVVLYVGREFVISLLEAANRKKAIDEFIWIGSDGFGLGLDIVGKRPYVLPTTLVIKPYFENVHKFDEYMENVLTNHVTPNIIESNINPTVKNNLIQNEPGDIASWTSAYEGSSTSYVANTAASAVIDIITAFALALDTVIREQCPEAFSDKSHLRSCIEGEDLLKALMEIHFNGSSGEIAFDDNGDMLGKYEISQIGRTDRHPETLGTWCRRMELLNITNNPWSRDGQEIPVSSCGQRCGLGEIYYFTKATCCWECRECKNNEIVSLESTRCEPCPELWWPSDTNRTSCDRIVAEYVHISDITVLVMDAIACVGFISTVCLCVVYYRNREQRIIRSTSRELSYIMLSGIGLGFVIVLTLMAGPNEDLCYVNFVGFSMTFTLVYAPLLMRTNRIYRIFHAGSRTKKLPQCTSPSSQILIVVMMTSFQALLVTVTVVITPPSVIEQMPIPTQKFSERFCDFPLIGLITTFSYNLILVLICTFYAFKTRKLPDNYNESRYIAFCVDTTLLIWLTFLPSYFTASRAYYRIAILAAALILHAAVNLLCLFFPKLRTLRQLHKEKKTSDGQTSQPLRVMQKSLLSVNGTGGFENKRTHSCMEFRGINSASDFRGDNSITDADCEVSILRTEMQTDAEIVIS